MRSVKSSRLVVAAACFACVGLVGMHATESRAQESRDPGGDSTGSPDAHSAYVLGYTMNRIDGTPESLETYKGEVILVVNVASKCGLTPQYEALEKLYDSYKQRGFVILGFPANNFGNQEPGSNEEIAEFCTSRFDVTFPMFEKISVKGTDQHPLYQQLQSQPDPVGGEPKWNFTKFLVDRSGNVVARFEPRTAPDDPNLIAQLEAVLGAD